MKSSNSLYTFSKVSGFTLVELVMVIAVIALLLGIAVPSYRGYVLRANRSEAIDILLSTAACQERVYTKFNQYDATRCDSNSTTANGYYTIEMDPKIPSQNFTLTASPQGTQNKDTCGNLSLTDQAYVAVPKPRTQRRSPTAGEAEQSEVEKEPGRGL